ncbi:MAG TPA: AAA family ATPase [Streptosporangiaceae bacterium]|nr:AAA family ATPase [Streptosporangiaceae bacterium]
MAADGRDFVRPAERRRVREFALGTRALPAGLVIQGEAGAGKSTLWRAGVEAAGQAGHRLLRSEPSASEADLSFAGLSDLLADVLPGAAAQIPGPQREALEVALLLRPASEEPPTARAVGLAVLATLRACASEGPVLVAIDDVQWLDDASLEALTFALRRLSEGPLSLLAAARTEAAADPLTAGAPPPSHGWQDLLAALPAELIDLAPLDIWQIQNLLPPTVTAAQARLVARQSRGNPFWAMEILASLDSAESTVPPLARALTDRISRSLTAEAAEALAVVAAAGRIGVAEALAVLAHLSDPAAALDAAVLAGVVVENRTRVSVAHPLIGGAAVESLPPGRRVQLYRRLAEASSGPERYAHFAALGASPGPDGAVAGALDSAAAAAHARAGNAAAALFATQAVAFTPEPDSDALVRRRIRAGELLFLAGDIEGSLQHLDALDIDRLATPDLERALPLLLDMADLVRGAAAAAAIVTHAVEVAGADPRRCALVLALASDIVYGIRGGRRAAAAEAISCAEAAGAAANPSLHRALVNLAAGQAAAGGGLDTGLLDRASGLEASLPVLRLYDSADLYRGLWSRYVDDLDLARAALGRCIARAADIGDDYAQCAFLTYLALTEVLAGDFAAATRALDAADAAAMWHDWPPSPWYVESRCELLIAAGDLDGAVRLAEEHLPDVEARPTSGRFMGACIRGKVAAWRGDAATTIRHLERAAEYADQCEWADPGVRDRVDPPLAWAYVAVGRPEDGRQISAWLREIGRRLGRPALVGDACRIDALAAAADGDLEAAAESARAAVTAHGASPLRVELALSLLALGRIERRRKARSQSRGALSQARELAIQMGHRPLLAEIERELPRVAAARSGTELTATERRVAELIADGATNRDAAAALFVSVRTVETHVASIYRKLGVRTRAELARRLHPADQRPAAP